MTYVRLREVGHLRLNLPSSYQFLRGLKWVPLAVTELHLTSHYLPIAIRLSENGPQLGAILDPAYLARPPLDGAGLWRLPYKPIAIRTIPLRLTPTPGNDPLQDVELPADSPFLSSDDKGNPILREDGNPHPSILSLRQLLMTLREGQRSLPASVDQLLIADLLVPLEESGSSKTRGADAEFHVIDLARFARLGNQAVGALARHSFTAIDIAVSSIFSQRTLRSEWLPKEEPEKSRAVISRLQNDLGSARIGLGNLPVTLDEGELFSLEDLNALRLGAD